MAPMQPGEAPVIVVDKAGPDDPAEGLSGMGRRTEHGSDPVISFLQDFSGHLAMLKARGAAGPG